MNILISNDDGIYAPGIKLLCEALSDIEGVQLFVCAPDTERSCIGHGLTIRGDLFLYDASETDLGRSVVWTKKCSGTPGDCVRLALYVLGRQNISIDLVCTGINNGLNAGSDINYSGTVAAAREAVLDGYPAIAFSSSHGTDYLDNFRIIIPEIMSRFAGRIPEKHILNVNAPNIPWSRIKGYRAAHLAHHLYPPIYTLMDDAQEDPDIEAELKNAAQKRQRYAFASFSMDRIDAAPDDDSILVEEGYITVSLIPLLQDSRSSMPLVEEMLK